MDEQKKLLGKLTVVRVIEAYEQIQAMAYGQPCLSLLSWLVAQTDNDNEIVVLFQKRIILDYQYHKSVAYKINTSQDRVIRRLTKLSQRTLFVNRNVV
ncbi:hypothetical protein QJS10_CPA05g01415 [Acorus calamus]|uniref:Uncharacterized protein n=1 Tax=Acorus calamus TaxID=4465 RepID=A0AAV9EYJ1_ACOCL|nr:hypothetical protein QJS10_CPA05g01415 [Acorus calamus]